MKKQYLIIEHRNSASFNSQRQQIALLKKQLEQSISQYKELERKYCNEVYYNNCLCDLLRENHIKYREVFDFNYRRVKFPSV